MKYAGTNARAARGACLWFCWAALGLIPVYARAQADPEGTREAWDAIYVGDSKVGHIHLWIKPVKDSQGRELRNVRVDYELAFQRDRDVATMKMRYGTIETPDGEVLRLDTRTQGSGQDIRAFGDVINGQMVLTLETGGRPTQERIDWGPEVRGPYGPEMSLSYHPIKPGEVREVKFFIPDLNRIGITTLSAVDFEDIPLGPDARPHRLLRVESKVSTLDGKPISEMDATHWVDETGQLLKTYVNQLGGMYIYRTTKAGALAPNGRSFNLTQATILRVPQAISGSERTRYIVYKLENATPEMFPNDQRQSSRVEPDGWVRLEVRTDSPLAGDAGSAQVEPEYLRPNPLVDSGNPEIGRLSRQAVGNRTDPWQRAAAIQSWVFRNMKRKNFSTAFAPASEVARTLSGDCTEHSVLTAAMCRAVGVPARCVVGLVYAETLGGFGPHMWNEVYVNGRWVAIDSAFDQSEVDATHIKLTATSLDGVAPFEAFLPVLRVINQVKIIPLEVR